MSGAVADRRILITGAANGIGLASVERFLAEGAGVAALDRDEIALAAMRSRFNGAKLRTLQADVTDPTAVAAAIADGADALGGLDGVVNAAGLDLVADIEAMALTDWNPTARRQLDRADAGDAGSLSPSAGGGRRHNRQCLFRCRAVTAKAPHRLLRVESRAADGFQGAGDGSGGIRHSRQCGLSGRRRDLGCSAPASTQRPTLMPPMKPCAPATLCSASPPPRKSPPPSSG